jgi:hypothetical protein
MIFGLVAEGANCALSTKISSPETAFVQPSYSQTVIHTLILVTGVYILIKENFKITTHTEVSSAQQ